MSKSLPLPRLDIGQYLCSYLALFKKSLDTHLPHLDLGRALLGKAGEQLDQPVRELQVLVVQRAEQTLSSVFYHDYDDDGQNMPCEVSRSCSVFNCEKTQTSFC